MVIKDRLPYGKIDVNMIEIYADEFAYFLEVRNIVQTTILCKKGRKN